MRSNPVAAIILIVIGALLLADNLIPNFHITRMVMQWWPLALIVLGISMLFRNKSA